MHRLTAGLLLWLGVIGHARGAGLPVIDASNVVQTTITATNSLRQVLQQAQQLSNEVTQIQNQLTQIQHLYTQVQHGVQNLQRFDVSSLQAVLSLAQQVDSKLNQARVLGYQAQQITTQVERYFPYVEAVLDAEQLQALQAQWTAALRDAGQTGALVQAVQHQQQDTQARMAEITRKVSTSQGNLDTLQGMSQQNAVISSQLISIEAQLAAQGRIAAAEALRKANQEEQYATFLQQVRVVPAVEGYVPRGQVPQLGR